MIISLTMCSIAALCVALRFVTKVWIAGNVLGLDDYFLGVALVGGVDVYTSFSTNRTADQRRHHYVGDSD